MVGQSEGNRNVAYMYIRSRKTLSVFKNELCYMIKLKHTDHSLAIYPHRCLLSTFEMHIYAQNLLCSRGLDTIDMDSTYAKALL